MSAVITPVAHWFKRWWVCFSCLMCMGAVWAQGVQAVPPLTARVMDYTGTLTPAQIAQIEQPMAQLESRRGTQMVVLLVHTTAPEDIAPYANRVASSWKLGDEKTGEGVLVVLALNDRKVRIEVARALEGRLPDLLANRIIQNDMTPAFKAGDYAQGILNGVNRVAQTLADPAAAQPTPPTSAEGLDLRLFGQMMGVTGFLLFLLCLWQSKGQWGSAIGEALGGVIFSTLGAGLFYLPGMLFDWFNAAYVGYLLAFFWFSYLVQTRQLTQSAEVVNVHREAGRVVTDVSGKVLGRILTERPVSTTVAATGALGASSSNESSSDSGWFSSSVSSSFSSDGGGSFAGGGSSGSW